MRLIFLLLTFVSTFSAFSQTGIVRGKVTNKSNGNAMVDASVTINGASGEMFVKTDLDGKFEFLNVTAGAYVLMVTNQSMIPYSKEIIVVEGKPYETDIILETKTAKGATVSATRNVTRNAVTEDALRIKQKTMAGVSDGITAEGMKSQPVKNAGDVIKRISGGSMQDNKFAIIRGLSDRYNFALINGSPLPSSEADRKAFSFDLVPANLLDNMVIYKTATPDMPSEFSGGVISLNTKDIPEKSFQSFSIGSGYNTLITFKPNYTYKGGKFDFLGFDDGTRALPNDLAATDKYVSFSNAELINQTKKFNSTMSADKRNSSLPNLSLQYNIGKKFNVFKKEAGMVFALTYNNSLSYKEITLQDYASGEKIYKYNDAQYSQNILWGSLFNVALKLNKLNRLSFKNTLNVNSEDQTTIRTGSDLQAGTDRKTTALYYQQNILYTSQLTGDHYLPASAIRLKWILGYSNINRDIPDFRRITYARQSNTEEPFRAFLSTNASPNDGGRFFSNLQENVYNVNYEFSKTLNAANGKFKTDLKMGGYSQLRSRTFEARVLGYAITNSGQFDQNLLALPADKLFAPENIGMHGFVVKEATNRSDQYTASSGLNAGFIMLDNKFKVAQKVLKIVWGVRLEAFHQQLKSFQNAPVEVNTTKSDFLPSINMSYALTDNSNLRLAASKTLSRPEFRELAPFSFFDFNRFIEIVGNDKLKRTDIQNYDFRYEYFPGEGQVFAVSAFYKNFNNPIEQTLNPDIGAGTISTTYSNAKNAQNYGLELEYRHKLGFIGTNQIFKNMTFVTNIAVIKSKVNVSNIAGAETRPLQGQSPYVANISMNYMSPKENGWGFSGGVNRIGKRIAFVGTSVYPDFYEKPRTVIDFQVTKNIGKKFEMKANVSDLLANNIVVYQNPIGNKNKVYESGIDYIMRSTRVGANYGLSIVYKF